jgi:hypothetical protein
MKISRIGLTLGLGYLVLFFVTGLYAIYLLVFHTATSELCGVPAIVITLPWSMLFIPLENALGIVEWYSRFSSTPAVYGFLATLTLLPSALINAGILYYVGSMGSSKKESER